MIVGSLPTPYVNVNPKLNYFLSRRLIHLEISTFLCHKLAMRSLLYNLACSHNNNSICCFDGVQSLNGNTWCQSQQPFLGLKAQETYMSNQNHCPTALDVSESFLDKLDFLLIV